MNSSRRRLALLLSSTLVAACATMPRAEIVPAQGADTSYRLRYADGKVSVNTHCAIQLANALNPAMPALYVNGEPVGFC